MAEFLTAYYVVKRNEGGYANVKGDAGGETYKGIARNYFPNWRGWLTIDNYKKQFAGGIIPHNHVFKNAVLDGMVLDFYRVNFWDAKAKGDSIKSQQLANFVFDTVVNHGRGVSHVIQRGINAAIDAERLPLNKLPETNNIANLTLNALNSYGDKVYPYLLRQREIYYRSLADFAQFGRGWMDRLRRFPSQLSDFLARNGAASIFAVVVAIGLIYLLTKK